MLTASEIERSQADFRKAERLRREKRFREEFRRKHPWTWLYRERMNFSQKYFFPVVGIIALINFIAWLFGWLFVGN
jgi:hypothetical protein